MPLYRVQPRYRFNFGSGGGTNTWCIRTVGADIADGDLADAIAALKAFYTACAPLLTNNTVVSFDGVVREISGEPRYVDPADPWSVTGSGGGGAGPAAGQACVSWKTSSATRRGRGRTFIGPLATNAIDVNDGTLTTTRYQGLLVAAGQLIDASSSAGQWAIAVYSELDGVARDIVAAGVTDQVAVLRSRRG